MRLRARITASMVLGAALAVVVIFAWQRARVDGPALNPAPALAGASDERLARAVPAARGVAVVNRVDAFLSTGWLRGTELDGSWGEWRGGVLQPSLGLRRRFDYLLSGIDTVPLADMRQWIESNVAATHGIEGARAVLAVWDGYVGLRRSGADSALDMDDPQSWPRAMDERTQRRRAALGPAWAYAFFAEEDAQLMDQLRRRMEAKSSPKPTAQEEQMSLMSAPDHPLTADELAQRDARRAAVFGPEAAQRMHDVDAADADFQARLSAARQRSQEIQHEPQLSALQREQQQSADLEQRFSGNDLVRAKALLSIVSTGS